jgi:CHAT domain-containing protein
MYTYFIPVAIREYIAQTKPANLITITTSEHDIPWELINDGDKFWSLKYNIGRILSKRDPGKNEPEVFSAEERNVRIAVVADLRGDLSEAKEEGKEIKKLLENESGIIIESPQGPTITKMDFLQLLINRKYDIIHYAGHAKFDIDEPEKSALKMYDGDLTFDEIKRIRFAEDSRPIVFANACSSSKTKFVGDKTVSLASAFVEAGALAYIGTMWPVKDKSAAFFAARFYNHLKQKTIGESLKMARADLLNKYSHSHDWAPYTLFGATVRRIRKEKKNGQKEKLEHKDDKRKQ